MMKERAVREVAMICTLVSEFLEHFFAPQIPVTQVADDATDVAKQAIYAFSGH